ncbi:maleylpyruvate isomerase N-terminal domain-containing protein [Streptomyces sp. ARC32]
MRPGDRTEPARVVGDAYDALAAVVRPLGDEESWLPTGCTGWAVRDLMFHLLADARRALVALNTPPPARPTGTPSPTGRTGRRTPSAPPTGGATTGSPRACSSTSGSSRRCAWRPLPPPHGPRPRPRRTARCVPRATS